MSPFARLSFAGFCATAISYGPARMGFGLFLPQFGVEFDISSKLAGIISSLGFLGFLLGLMMAGVMTMRRGPRLPVLCGLLAAAIGMGLVAAAANVFVLAGGVFLAMSSAGFSWTPFNNAVHRRIADEARPASLSIVSTGTSVGIVAAGAAALAMGFGGVSWRMCWALFAVAGTLSFLINRAALKDMAGDPGSGAAGRWRALVQKPAAPLFAVSFIFGVTSAIYISFAVDIVARAGGISGLPASASGSVIFICYGVFGFLGLVTGAAKKTVGLPGLLRLLFLFSALSHLAVAVAAGHWAGIIASAGLQGVYVMMTSAILAFWSDRLFPERPSQSFTAVLLAMAAGSVLGPAVAGFALQALGGEAMFLGTAALAIFAAISVRAKLVRERPG